MGITNEQLKTIRSKVKSVKDLQNYNLENNLGFTEIEVKALFNVLMEDSMELNLNDLDSVTGGVAETDSHKNPLLERINHLLDKDKNGKKTVL